MLAVLYLASASGTQNGLFITLLMFLRAITKTTHMCNSNVYIYFRWNGMWLAIVTMTTVGYGNFYPRTNFGRLNASLAAFWGLYIIALLVTATREVAKFSEIEKRVGDN